MDHELINVLIWLAVAVSLLVLIQVAVLGALFLVLLKVRSTVSQIQKKFIASGVDLYEMAGKSYRLLGVLETATKKAAEQVESLKQGLTEARSRVARADQSVCNLLACIERGSETLKHALAEPAIRCLAVVAAIRTALGTLNRWLIDHPTEHDRRMKTRM